MPGLLRGDERKPHRWCFAKKAAAFFRISRSSWRIRFSLRSRASSSRSAVVRPVFPLVRSACALLDPLPQRRLGQIEIARDAATLLPSSSTSRTACCLEVVIESPTRPAASCRLPSWTSYPPFGRCPRNRIKSKRSRSPSRRKPIRSRWFCKQLRRCSLAVELLAKPATRSSFPPPARDDDAAVITAPLTRLAGIMDGLETSTDNSFKIYQAVATRLRGFARCRDVNVATAAETPICDTDSSFEQPRALLEQNLRDLLGQAPPSTEEAALLTDVLKKALTARLAKDTTPPGPANWLSNATSRLTCYARLLENMLELRKLMLTARDELRKSFETVVALKTQRRLTTVLLRQSVSDGHRGIATCPPMSSRSSQMSPRSRSL